MASISVVIPTYNREEELVQCIRSILGQDDRPEEIVVVDDGSLGPEKIEEECRAAGVAFRLERKETPGLTASRNLGVAVSRGDLILFFDDDVVLKPGYIRAVREAYDRDAAGEVGGIGGVIDNFQPLTLRQKMLRAYQLLFMMTGFREGKVLLSGFVVHYGDAGPSLARARFVDFLPGCAMSFRRKVFEGFSFDTASYPGFGIGEDVDFSYRVSRVFKLRVEPRAKLDHLVVQKTRPEKYDEGYMFFKTFYLNFVRHFKRGWWAWIFFAYALFGYGLMKVLVALLGGRPAKLAYVRGLAAGAGDAWRGKMGRQ